MGRTGEKVSIQIHAELFKICEKIFKQFVCVSALFLSDFKRSFLSTMWQPTLRIVILSKNITKIKWQTEYLIFSLVKFFIILLLTFLQNLRKAKKRTKILKTDANVFKYVYI